jgi:hypothetical protein
MCGDAVDGLTTGDASGLFSPSRAKPGGGLASMA